MEESVPEEDVTVDSSGEAVDVAFFLDILQYQYFFFPLVVGLGFFVGFLFGA